ncbi:PDZ domain-containing protein [Nakamurella sp. YIM 132087]|uniref:PDZ domain-containing protein n=1 Tax=Nakamurella alba TaxID=2665158 RepID=A0A7K1FKS2_9ACTN|nr:trypsin-like peptidase domain-containing protein [Nakamurella alba]MTD14742.1 PDZ domain-containing protein [Nakamurella alba]
MTEQNQPTGDHRPGTPDADLPATPSSFPSAGSTGHDATTTSDATLVGGYIGHSDAAGSADASGWTDHAPRAEADASSPATGPIPSSAPAAAAPAAAGSGPVPTTSGPVHTYGSATAAPAASSPPSETTSGAPAGGWSSAYGQNYDRTRSWNESGSYDEPTGGGYGGTAWSQAYRTGATPAAAAGSTGSAGSTGAQGWSGRTDPHGFRPAGFAPAVGGAHGAPQGGTTTVPSTRGRKRSGRTVGIIAVATVLALGAGFGGGVLGARVGSSSTAAAVDNSLTQNESGTTVSDTQPVASGVQAVANKVLPSVVSILSVSQTESGEGSGIILSSDGLILTNNHVVAGAEELTVRFNDGTTATAKIIGADATDDLAVIKADGVSGLTVAALGSSDAVEVGQPVVAIGSPLGLSATVTSGIVSALDRPVRTSSSDSQQQQPGGQQTTTQDTVLNAIQTDAAINPGNSGGPLVNMNGEVIGINSAIASLSSSQTSQGGSIGVGFAIPIDQARRIAQEIVDTGKASHAVLGASVSDATAAGTNDLLTTGAEIADVTSGGGAAGAGLQAGDVITKVGDQTVESADALIAAIRAQDPGSQVEITYLRGTTSATATVTLGSATSE